MPILTRETDLFPETLLHNPPGDGAWWVFFTAPQREKRLMRELLARGLSFYGAIAPKKNRSSNGRVRTSYVPLFPNYVFFCGTEEERILALKTDLVLQSIPVNDGKKLAADLLRLKLLIETGLPVSHESKLEAGRRVRIKSGSLLNHEGTIIQRRGCDLLVISVDFLQQGASVLLEDFQVEPID